MLHREHAAPGLAEDVVAVVDSQLMHQGPELPREQLDGPEAGGGMREMLRAPAADLVIEHARSPADPREFADRLQVVVRRPRTAVEDHERGRPAGVQSSLQAKPGPMPVPLDEAVAHAPRLRGAGPPLGEATFTSGLVKISPRRTHRAPAAPSLLPRRRNHRRSRRSAAETFATNATRGRPCED